MFDATMAQLLHRTMVAWLMCFTVHTCMDLLIPEVYVVTVEFLFVPKIPHLRSKKEKYISEGYLLS